MSPSKHRIEQEEMAMVITGHALRHLHRLVIVFPIIVSTLAISSVSPIRAQSASARVKLAVTTVSIGDESSGVVTVRYTANDQVNRWTITHPRETLLIPRGALVRLSETPSRACHCVFQWTLSGDKGRFHPRSVTRPKVSFTVAGATQVTAEYVMVTGDISLVPSRPDVVLEPLASSEARVSPFVALNAAKAAWGLSDAQIDPHIGVVRALFSIRNDRIHQNIKAWMVVADMKTYCPAPGCNTIYGKMVIVVDAATGKGVLSYPAVPSQIPPSVGPPPLATAPPPGTPPPTRVYPPSSTSHTPTATPPPTPTPGTPGPWTGSGPAPTPTPTPHR